MKLIMENWKKFINEKQNESGFRDSITMEAVGLKGEVIRLTIYAADPRNARGREISLKSELGSNDLAMDQGDFSTPVVDKIKMAMEDYVETVYGGQNSEQNLQAMIKKNAQLLSHISKMTFPHEQF